MTENEWKCWTCGSEEVVQIWRPDNSYNDELYCKLHKKDRKKEDEKKAVIEQEEKNEVPTELEITPIKEEWEESLENDEDNEEQEERD